MNRCYDYVPLEFVEEMILEEVKERGYSEGWNGSLVSLSALKGRLRSYGVVYVDDILGRWEAER